MGSGAARILVLGGTSFVRRAIVTDALTNGAGLHDPRDGPNHWVRRAARGGRVAVPGDRAQPIQIIDMLARLDWMP